MVSVRTVDLCWFTLNTLMCCLLELLIDTDFHWLLWWFVCSNRWLTLIFTEYFDGLSVRTADWRWFALITLKTHLGIAHFVFQPCRNYTLCIQRNQWKSASINGSKVCRTISPLGEGFPSTVYSRSICFVTADKSTTYGPDCYWVCCAYLNKRISEANASWMGDEGTFFRLPKHIC